jgi:hypothetical protein
LELNIISIDCCVLSLINHNIVGYSLSEAG